MKITEKLNYLFVKQKSLAKDTVWLILLNVLQKFFGFLTTYFLVRTLSPSVYGEYNFILTIVSLVVVTALPNLDDAVLQSASRGYVGTYKNSLKIKFLFSLLGSLILVGFGGWFFLENNQQLFYGFCVAAIIFPFAYGFTQWKCLRIGQGNFSVVTKFDGLSVMITSILIIISTLIVPDKILLPILVTLLIKAFFDIGLSFLTYRDVQNDNKVEEGSIHYGMKASLFTILTKIALTIDKILIFFFMSPVSLATYVAAEKLPELVKTLIKSLASALAPRFAKHAHYTAQVDNALKLFSLITFVTLVIFTFTLMPAFMLFIFGEAYVEAIPYGQALMLITAIGNISFLKGRFFKSKLDEKSMKDFTVSTSLIRIVASSICIPIWGLNGAVASFFIARMSTNIAVYIIMKKRYPVKK